MAWAALLKGEIIEGFLLPLSVMSSLSYKPANCIALKPRNSDDPEVQSWFYQITGLALSRSNQLSLLKVPEQHRQAIFPGKKTGIKEKDSVYGGWPPILRRESVSAGTQEIHIKKVIRNWANCERLVKNMKEPEEQHKRRMPSNNRVCQLLQYLLFNCMISDYVRRKVLSYNLKNA